MQGAAAGCRCCARLELGCWCRWAALLFAWLLAVLKGAVVSLRAPVVCACYGTRAKKPRQLECNDFSTTWHTWGLYWRDFSGAKKLVKTTVIIRLWESEPFFAHELFTANNMKNTSWISRPIVGKNGFYSAASIDGQFLTFIAHQ